MAIQEKPEEERIIQRPNCYYNNEQGEDISSNRLRR